MSGWRVKTLKRKHKIEEKRVQCLAFSVQFILFQTHTSACYTYSMSVVLFKSLTLTRQTFVINLSCIYLHSVLWELALTHVGSICVILCPFVVSHQVGEIEEQLAAARREVTKSEEANQKLQREVKEVCRANVSLPGQNPKLPGLQVYI